MAAMWLRRRLKADEHGPYASRNEAFDHPDSEPEVEHGFQWVNGLENAG